MKDTIICLVGESGSGKSTIAEELSKKGYNYIESYTTRKPRYEGERGHIFVSDVPYEVTNNNGKAIKKINKTDMIAYTYFDNNHYWATRKQYMNKGISVYVIDPEGINELKKKIKNVNLIIIYIKTDAKTRINRMLKREDVTLMQVNYNKVYAKAIQRIQHDRKKFRTVVCDYVIDGNGPLEDVLVDIEETLNKQEDTLIAN